MSFFVKQCVAEGIGTFFLVFIGCGAVIVSQSHPGSMPPAAVALAFGGVISVMVYAVGHISGAHFNPAVTLAFAVTRHFPLKQVAGYWIAQCLGAILASSFHRLLFGAVDYSLGNTTFQSSWPTAFAWEVLCTFLLMFVIISVATDTRAKGEMAGLAIGTTVAICALVGGPLTGASINPARSLGPALISGHLDQLWLYILAPLVGAILGALIYERIRDR